MTNVVTFRNFSLAFFGKLIEQNLMADNSINIKFTKEQIMSAAKTSSESLIKFWHIPTQNLIAEPEEEEILDFNDDGSTGTKLPEFADFNFYVLKGDMFKRFLNVFSDDPVVVNIEVDDEDSVASKITITGQTKSGTPIQSSYMLSSAELMTSGVKDYNVVMNYVQPKEGLKSFFLLKDEVDEVKKLIKDLHKTNSENTAYVKFEVNVEKKIVTVSDKVFKVKFQLIKSEADTDRVPTSNLEFMILKSDFITCGKHTFEFFFNEEDQKIVMKSSYKKFAINCACINLSVRDQEQKVDDIENLDDLGLDVEDLDNDYFDQ